MSLTARSLRNPYAVIALALTVVVLGFAAYRTARQDLFPETAPPQISVSVTWAGATADDMVEAVTEPLEKELASLEGVLRLTSNSGDGMAAVTVEFAYGASRGEVLTEAENALMRAASLFPAEASRGEVRWIDEANRPVVLLALSPAPGSPLSLREIRLLAEKDLTESLLNLPGVARVEVFGGASPQVTVEADRNRLEAYGLTLADVRAALAARNVKKPAGRLTAGAVEESFALEGRFASPRDVADLPLAAPEGSILRLGDVASVSFGDGQRRSLFRGNGRPAVALSVLRGTGADTVRTIEAVKAHLSELEARHRSILFSVVDDQQPLIDVNIAGMRGALLQALILTVLVIFVFLADWRSALTASLSIPLSFLSGFIALKVTGQSLNMVTLSGLIVSVGMVVDASVVVIENIHRHGGEGLTAAEAARRGTDEVALSITGGMLTTVVVLIPLFWAGGYTGQVLRPLALVIATTLVASLLAALTVIPLAATVTAGGKGPLPRLERLTEGFLAATSRLYLGLTVAVLRRPRRSLALFALFAVATVRLVVPLLGAELMPPMDTAIATVTIETPADASPEEVERVLEEVESVITTTEGVVMMAFAAGAEPGVTSVRGGSTPQEASLTVHLVNRTERRESIWQIQQEWREALAGLGGLKSFRVSEYGATPLATTKAPLDVILSGPDAAVLDELGDAVLGRLTEIGGLTDLRRSWHFDKEELLFSVNADRAAYEGVAFAAVAEEASNALNGALAGRLRLDRFRDIPIRVGYRADQVADAEDAGQIRIATPRGLQPLRILGDFSPRPVRPVITRENLAETLDVTGANRGRTIAAVAAEVKRDLAPLPLPPGYSLEVAGSARDLASSRKTLQGALLLGLALLYLLLAWLFRSLLQPLYILSVVPLAVAGGLWGLLLLHKPLCMPASMGFILLGGTVVNNSILMIDFITQSRRQGASLALAIVRSVQLRLRPILMTAFSTVLGMMPLVLERAIGLERMSPLGIVAVFGLALGTVLTLVFLPLVYGAVEGLRRQPGESRAVDSPER